MKHLIILLFIISQGTYAQEIQVATASSSVSATITRPLGMQYNPASGRIQTQGNDSSLYDLHVRVPDTLTNIITRKRYAVICTLQDSVCKTYPSFGGMNSKFVIETIVPPGIYRNDLNKDTVFVTVHYY